MINLYTDGSVQHNGKPEGYAGWAMVCIDNPAKLVVRYGHLKPTSTNSRGEIGGVLYAMALMHKAKHLPITVFSDAQYVVKSIMDWRHKHKRFGYQGIKNGDMLVPLYEMWDAHGNAQIEWVRGHNGNKGNEIADVWAGRGCKQNDMSMQSETADIKYISDETFNETVNNAYAALKGSHFTLG